MQAALDAGRQAWHDQWMTEPTSFDLSTAALRGDLTAVDTMLPESDPNQRLVAAALACEQGHLEIALRLVQPSLEGRTAQNLRNCMTVAARHGHAAVVARLVPEATRFDLTEVMVGALLGKQRACVDLLAPLTDLDEVVEDLKDNYDDSYRLSYEQMARCVDQLSSHFDARQVRQHLQDLGEGLLPHLAARQQAQARAARTPKLDLDEPTEHTRRRRVRRT